MAAPATTGEQLPAEMDNRPQLPAHETSMAAMAAQAKARVEARYIVAMQRPRDMDTVRTRLLKECSRPGFADASWYSKPVGGRSIEGLSIRFAEAAVRLCGNLDVDTPVIFEDDEKRIIRVAVTDLETNSTFSTDIVVNKTVERRKVRQGQDIVGTRENTSGQMVYIVKASDDELANKAAALTSKAIRNNALRLLPADIKDECATAVKATMRNRDAQDPDAARKRMMDAFSGLGIEPKQIKAYLGHDTEQTSAKEREELLGIYNAIRDGETTWAAVMEAREAEKSADSSPGNGSRKGRAKAAQSLLDETNGADSAPDAKE